MGQKQKKKQKKTFLCAFYQGR